ncbi:hypothetical protein C9374_004659 [Naegleria lovaniensis]|uniref:Uncharacterized protein n=1 Tax=Naegleria lovaniensis TaxID=51637 RepID=A0AA88GRP2_NAELO|nr:uncharacterized protein C9374_004659 [Naegleria lovaniensis]KAG2383322.1 hypothetical protein C9374_004659 [Naegleria lovaniensis]
MDLTSWKTARLMRAITQKTFKVICWLTNISIVVFLIIGWTVVLLVSIFLTLGRFEIVDKTTNTIVNICCLLIVTILFVIDTISVTTSGILVMRTIRRTASKVKDTVAQQKAKNPFVITIALMIGLIACVLLQIIAAVIASAIVLVDERFKVLWHFVNCLGILIFATLTLLLFYPMFVQTDKVMKELHLDDTKSNISNYSGTAHGEIPNSPIKTSPYHKSMPRFSGLADNQQEGLSLVISTEVARLTPMPHPLSVPTSVVVVEDSNTKASVESSSFAAHSTTVTAVSTTGTDERTLMTSSPMEASSGNNLSSEMTII